MLMCNEVIEEAINGILRCLDWTGLEAEGGKEAAAQGPQLLPLCRHNHVCGC